MFSPPAASLATLSEKVGRPLDEVCEEASKSGRLEWLLKTPTALKLSPLKPAVTIFGEKIPRNCWELFTITVHAKNNVLLPKTYLNFRTTQSEV